MGDVVDIRTHSRFIFNQMTQGLSDEEREWFALNPGAIAKDVIDEEFYDQQKEEIDEMALYSKVHKNMKSEMHDFKSWLAWMAFEVTVMMLREDKELVTE